MKKNEEYEVLITDLNTDGEGVGKVDAFPLFVKNVCIGDLALVRVMKLKKTYGYARLLRVIKPSIDRCEARCAHAVACGGCQLQQMDYAAQLLFKTEKVRQNLKRIGGFDVDVPACLGMQDPWHYRNKSQVPVGRSRDGRTVTGFYAHHSHDIIESDGCALTFQEAETVLRIVRGWMEAQHVPPYDEQTGKGLVRHVLSRKGFATGQVMVCIIAAGRVLPYHGELLRHLKAEVPGFTTLTLNVNVAPGNTILGQETLVLYGPGVIEDEIDGLKFSISANSFYQVNPVQTSVLYGKALEFAGLTGNETVWDVYCGIGTISLFLARCAKKVYGVEIVPQAIEDARRNAERNGLLNTEFFTGKAEEVLPAWHSEHPEEKIDVIVVDPPRKGCDAACLQTIVSMAPEKLVYVSCDSATLARDLKYLCGNGFRLDRVQPVDMFGMTVHVETVCLLSKLSDAKHHISVQVDMDELDLTAAESKATYEEIQEWVQVK
ncbi:MAG: 23S rRNA (uracil(1939)-C(5))-methyltransferase RlmD, partial [Lachnospiraceae bacterium]|nr:23S rRNA (uracil(1939)-C(5))-methyltransferase RlmD [Lachnospiraceae bacterium]